MQSKAHALIDAHAALVKEELKAMAKQAMKDIRRSASFDNRSAGQKRRRNGK